MNFEYFIARKLKAGDKKNLSKPVIGISTISIALGLSLMIISVAVVVGFKNSISEKVMNFASHIQLVVFDNNYGEQGSAINVNEELLDILNSQNEITHIQKVAHKAGVVKTKDQILGVVLKGVDSNFNKAFLESNISSGLFPSLNDSIKSNEVLISSSISRKLELNTGDDMRMWFVDGDQARARGRKFTISGIYDTGMEEIDDVYVIGDIKHIQKLNNWDPTDAGSIELMVNDVDKIRDVSFNLYTTIPYNIRSVSVFEEYPQIFNWLELLDLNVIVILSLLIIVSTITMISTLLILIIERTSMVGLLKALGTTNSSIRKIFLIKASGVIIRGMIWGNIIGIGFYYVQSYFRIIKLSAESYYVDYVPMELHISDVLMLNIGTFIISLLVLIIPTFYITRVMPARALRYE
ncbi:MAG: ABC transporter permease [Lentimicrobiaceae bacterium]|nr:ABC transporter permease [Lentimicrobiaceae bacterium]MCP4910332.1 ABC transporter permease [Bacteroidota bacterium]MBT3453931.1 ABC transporter permease [Lentimicrobiaceae bacterium]MBT3818542.1 ABC transporter permease [Lentimicrobiaceae bacterium]MBT4061962.1 ABC transporter permease [Lentimicrobiaceae bacterium]